jgi:triacylglycerol esterase/lipase EstA (alpha/beta hydrolase family)
MPLPTVILPGYLAGAIDYRGLQQILIEAGYPTIIVPLLKRDWLPTLGGRSVLPILERLHQTVEQVMQDHNSSQINLIGHSAGGWISRIYLGEYPYDVHGVLANRTYAWKAHSVVSNLLTLGTPHTSFERWTRINLDFVNLTYPGAFYSDVNYVCVAGKAIYGERRPGSWLAYSSYQLTCGKGNEWGDGICPIESAHLDGAENLTLDQVKHSPRSGGVWYGSPNVVPQWMNYLA